MKSENSPNKIKIEHVSRDNQYPSDEDFLTDNIDSQPIEELIAPTRNLYETRTREDSSEKISNFISKLL